MAPAVEDPDRHADVIIIGAGMAGLRAAGVIAAAGGRVVVLDKGRRHGGRMATRRVDDATFDTGAIAFTARSGGFRSDLGRWEASGHARISPEPTDRIDEATWRGAPLMRSLPSALASAIDATPGQSAVHLATQVTAVAAVPDGWAVTALHDGAVRTLTSAALVVTAPAPQTLALLDTGGRVASPTTLGLLAEVVYAPSLTVLARPRDRTLATTGLTVSPEVGRGTAAPDLARIHRNDSTGASEVVALTLQADSAFSSAHLDGDRDTAAATLAAQASTAIGEPLEVVHVHGWRYAHLISGIERNDGAPALLDTSSGAPLIIAGDVFGTGGDLDSIAASLQGVERAYLSGTAAAALVL
jgi:renalase